MLSFLALGSQALWLHSSTGFDHAIALSAWQSLSLVQCQILAIRFMVFRLSDVASCGSVLFIRLRQFPNLPRQLKSFRCSTSVSVTSLYMELSVSSGVASPVKIEAFNASDWHLVSCVRGFVSAMWSMHHHETRFVRCRTAAASTEAVSQIHEPRSHPPLNSPLSTLDPVLRC